jgi:2-polyprenyl-3-methyl-5-hydroxy-6-metoxy-1,4-benzoquinol methylase
MVSLTDDKGYNQMFAPSEAMKIRSERRCDMLLSAMNLTSKSRILELGCGTGEIANFIAGKTNAQVIGIDICKPFIEEAQKKHVKPNLSFEVIDFNDPQSLSGINYDYIIGNGILHHLYFDLDNALQNIKLLLKEEGKMIFLEPNLVNPYCYLIFSYPYFRKKANLEPDEMAFTKSYILKKLEKNRYTNNTVKYKDFLLPVTPKFLINSLIWTGNILERIPFLRMMSQSIFIVGQK